MKKLHFKIEIYDWDIFFIKIENKDDHQELKGFLKGVDVYKKDIKGIIKKVKSEDLNEGDHLFLGDHRCSIIIVYQASCSDCYINTISHEKRHCEDRILGWLQIKDIESAALIAGYLAEKIYPFALL